MSTIERLTASAGRFDTNDETTVERAGDGTPSAFRLWHSGYNDTDKGGHVFDDEAAASVMADFAKRGRLVFDWDHRQLDEDAPIAERRAAGTFALEVRRAADGPELWAVSISWTREARDALISGTWNYYSPAYELNAETRRPIRMINCALVNLPATHNAPRLSVAASRVAKPSERRADAWMTVMRYPDVATAWTKLCKQYGEAQARTLARALAEDPREAYEVRARAEAVLARDAQRRDISARMGLSGGHGAPRHEGNVSTFPMMTADEARRHLAGRTTATTKRGPVPPEVWEGNARVFSHTNSNR